MNIALPFIAALLGLAAALLLKPQSRSRIKLLLAFSGAFLLSAVASEFLPEIYGSGAKYMGMYLVAGVFVQIILEFFSKGAEHGHVHSHDDNKGIPVVLFVSLCIHAFLEGMPLQEDGHSMVYGIAVHKLPIAFIVSSFMLVNKIPKFKIIAIMLFFAAMSPLGSLLASNLELDDAVMLPLKAIVTGIILHVSTTLILEASEAHKFNAAKIGVMLLGAALGFMI
ncbi:MAG: ZIP family metal transporter [Nonlabens sp.]|nr:ZIP family metal transporter [Nonlabens sp.]